MNAHSSQRPPRFDRADAAVLAMTALLFAMFVAGVVILAAYGAPAIDPMAARIAELIMQEGIRFESAQMFPEAAAAYRQALEAEFDSHKNRLHTLRRLGMLVFKAEGAEKALPYLAEACEGPDAPEAAFQPLCNVLLMLGRFDEVVVAAGRWRLAAQRINRPDLVALAFYSEGKAQLSRGDSGAALEAFLQGNDTDPASVNAHEAAMLYYKEGKTDKAEKILESFLDRRYAGRVSSSRARDARRLYERIQAEKSPNPDISRP